MIIGKIPAYNSMTTQNANGIIYHDRLLSNLTIVNFTPIGYSINLDSWKDLNGIYRVGSDLKSLTDKANAAIYSDGETPIISSYSALKQWQDMQKFAGEDTVRDMFRLICTNDSTITETLSNSYNDNFLDKVGSNGGMLSKVSGMLKGGMQLASSLDTSTALGLLSKMQNFASDYGSAEALLMGKMIGIQSAFPKIWSSSNYNNTSSFTIKLISPSGHPDDVDKFVIQPLKHLILAASPVTFDGITYGYPPLWQIEAKGLVTLKLAGITALSISRGGQDTVFNRYNQPTNIDVRIVVEPVVQGFATPLLDNITDKPDEATGNVRMILQNSNAIIKPMLNEKIKDTSIELKPLSINN